MVSVKSTPAVSFAAFSVCNAGWQTVVWTEEKLLNRNLTDERKYELSKLAHGCVKSVIFVA